MVESGALALNKYAPHWKSMRKCALLESSNAREGMVVKIGQGWNFSDVGKTLCNSPYKTLLQQILAEVVMEKVKMTCFGVEFYVVSVLRKALCSRLFTRQKSTY
jgi:hypothetical protein